jgi:hypothetical protein
MDTFGDDDKMDQRHSPGTSDHSPSSPSGGPQKPGQVGPLAGRPNAALPCICVGEELGNAHGSDQDGESGLSDYSPRRHDAATSDYYDTGNERYRYSPTSPRYSPTASLHGLSDYSPREDGYDGASDYVLPTKSRSGKRLGSFGMRRDRTATAEAVGSHLKRKEASKIVSTESRKASSTSISAEQSKKLASAKARDNAASCEARDSYTGDVFGVRSKGGTRYGLGSSSHSHRERESAMNQQMYKRSIASADFVQFLIGQNERLSERLGKVETELVLVQSQVGSHKKPAPGTGDKHACNQYKGVTPGEVETEKAESALQHERLRLAWDFCSLICIAVAIMILLKLPKLMDAEMSLADQKTENLQQELLAHRNACR